MLSVVLENKPLEPQCRSKQWRIYSKQQTNGTRTEPWQGPVRGREKKEETKTGAEACGWAWLEDGRARWEKTETRQVNETIQIRNPEGKVQNPKQSQKPVNANTRAEWELGAKKVLPQVIQRRTGDKWWGGPGFKLQWLVKMTDRCAAAADDDGE